MPKVRTNPSIRTSGTLVGDGTIEGDVTRITTGSGTYTRGEGPFVATRR